jgi:hypothetical protein
MIPSSGDAPPSGTDTCGGAGNRGFEMARHEAVDRSRTPHAAFEPPTLRRGRPGARRVSTAVLLPLALALLLLAPSAAFALTWSDYGSNPVIAGGHSAYYPDMSYDAAAFSGHGTSAYYKAWYDDGANTWMAYSSDAKTWTDFGASPVLTGARHPKVLYDATAFGNAAGDFVNGVSGPTYSVTPYYKMWYWEMPDTIRFAYSADGANWQTNYTADVLPHESFPYWNGAPVYAVEIVRVGSTYRGWADNNGRFYNVSSPDGITWTVGSMALEVGEPGAWDDDSLSRCAVVYVPGGGAYAEGWYMFYGGTDSGGGGNRGIGLARSSDGLNWTRDPANPSTALGGYGSFGGLGAPGTWIENRNYAVTAVYSANGFDGHGDAAPIKMLRSGRTNAAVYTIGLAMVTPDAGPPANVPASSWWSLGLIGAAGLVLLALRNRRRQAA